MLDSRKRTKVKKQKVLVLAAKIGCVQLLHVV